MNWKYITGFFDADGSVTAVKVHSTNNRTLQVSFHNCELEILEKIQEFILKDINIKGSISCKKSKKKEHSDAYDLKYVYQNALKVANKLETIHPKKLHRIKVYNEVQLHTKRNGKYTAQEKLKRESLIEDFFKY